MILKDVFGGVGAFGTLVSVACTVWVTLRDSRWRKSGLAAQLDARVVAAERAAEAAMACADDAKEAAGRWHETTHGLVTISQIDKNTTRVARCEEILQHVATREDVARLDGKLGRIESVAETAANGIDRIESMLMKKALGA